MNSPYLSVGELALFLRKSEKWVYQQLNKGKIPGAFKLGGSWLIDRDILGAALQKRASAKASNRS